MPERPHPTDLQPAVRVLRSRRDAASTCLIALVSLACTAGLLVAAVILHPPVAIVPLLVIACVAYPVFGTWGLAPAVEVLRHGGRRSRRRAVASFRRALAALPEVEHPLEH